MSKINGKEIEKEEFIKAHMSICGRGKNTRRHHSPCGKRKCAENLYSYLIKNNLKLDIYHNRK